MLDLNDESTYTVMLDNITNAFFPNGENPVIGNVQQFETSIVNVSNRCVFAEVEDFTLRKYIQAKRVTGVVRFHLLCKTQELLPVFLNATPSGEVQVRSSVFGSDGLVTSENLPVPTASLDFRSQDNPASATEAIGGQSLELGAHENPVSFPAAIAGPSLELGSCENQVSVPVTIAGPSLDLGTAENAVYPATSDSPAASVLLVELQKQIKAEGANLVNVLRSEVMSCALRSFHRKKFNPTLKLNVLFIGEEGIDGGGPSREFMTLVLRELRHLPIFTEEGNLVLHHNCKYF